MITPWLKEKIKEAIREERRQHEEDESSHHYAVSEDADLWISSAENGWLIKVYDRKQKGNNKTHICRTPEELHELLNKLLALNLLGA